MRFKLKASVLYRLTTYIGPVGRRKRTLYLYVVTATNLRLLKANAETLYSVRTEPSGGCRR
jgi:hypothetical protein